MDDMFALFIIYDWTTNVIMATPVMLNDSTKKHITANAYAMTSKEALIRYPHQCLFIPTKRTLVKAIENKQLTTWPVLTTKAVQKHIPKSSPATNRRKMTRQRKGIH